MSAFEFTHPPRPRGCLASVCIRTSVSSRRGNWAMRASAVDSSFRMRCESA